MVCAWRACLHLTKYTQPNHKQNATVQVVAATGLFSALAYIATISVIHRDVKPANVLVVLDHDGLVLVKVSFAHHDFFQIMIILRWRMADGPAAVVD